MKVKTETLIKELCKRGYIRVLWQKDDVKEQAQNRGIDLTDKQVNEIVRLIERQHDCNVGLSWDVIDIFTDEILGK
jgi:uncharacterized protein YpuA (DUF1002 family)